MFLRSVPGDQLPSLFYKNKWRCRSRSGYEQCHGIIITLPIWPGAILTRTWCSSSIASHEYKMKVQAMLETNIESAKEVVARSFAIVLRRATSIRKRSLSSCHELLRSFPGVKNTKISTGVWRSIIRGMRPPISHGLLFHPWHLVAERREMRPS